MLVNPGIMMNNILQNGKKYILQAIMDSYDKLISHEDDEDDDTYEEDI